MYPLVPALAPRRAFFICSPLTRGDIALWRVWRNHDKLQNSFRCKTKAVPEDNDPDDLDIDALAKRLSEEAEKLRQSGASLDTDDSLPAGALNNENLLRPLGFQVCFSEVPPPTSPKSLCPGTSHLTYL